MKRKLQKILSILLTLCMLLSYVPAPALAAEGDAGATTTNGYYDADGNWVAGGNGSATYNVDGTNVTLSKTAAPTGNENEYEITLRVETSTTTTTYTDGGAVVLVIDVSGSMKYCSECGGEEDHDSDCTHYTRWNNNVTSGQSRMHAAKVAARSFLASYAGDDPNTARMVAIVAFQSSASTQLSWVNVAGKQHDYETALSYINDLSANGGTNLDDGLYHALAQLNSDLVKDFSSKNVIALTDGAPTRSRTSGDGTRGSETINSHTAAQATNVKNTGATLYTVCFGVANEYTYNGGPTVGNFLSGQVASSGCAYNADKSQDLYDAFAAITESITSGLSGLGWTATDPMADMISVTGGAGGNFYSSGDNTYTWTLADAEVVENGNVTTYVYTYKYTVKLDVQGQNFEEGKFFPTNDPTYLNIDGQQYAFPVPGVKGVLPRTDVSVTKVWDDANDQDRLRTDSVTVQLKNENGVVIGDIVTLNADNNWTYTWDGDTYNLIAQSKGVYHLYTVEELDVPDGYEVSYPNERGDFTLTVQNTHVTYKTEVTVTKVWDDNENSLGRRPAEIQVQLYANGAAHGAAVTLNEENGWSYTWENLELNQEGQEIVYTVDETAVPEGYDKSVDGFVITNKFVDNDEFSQMFGNVYITGQKIWDDNENAGGVRPESITVRLLADGVEVASQVVTGPDWTWSFDLSNGIPGTGANPVGVEFTVVEDTIENYTLTDTVNPSVEFNYPSADGGWTTIHPCSSLTITSTQDAKSIVVAKKGNTYVVWTVDPLASFERDLIVASYAASTNSSTDISHYSFINGMGASSNFGMTVTETEVLFGNTSYWSWLSYGTYNRGSASSTSSSLTNKVDPTSVTVTKVWNDSNNQDGVRPESITVNLLANGELVDTRTVTAAEGWIVTFDDLVKFADGKEIEYTVTEDAVENYTTSIDGYTITNTHTTAKTSVTVTKIWEDDNNRDSKRPVSVEVELYANGEATGKKLLITGDAWTGTFENLEKYYDGGKEITYTVVETPVAGYETSYSEDTLTITNTHVPELISISGGKTWDDNDNQDGKRPASITVNLLANGQVIDSVVVTEAENWTWTFEDLYKFENGKLVTYTITENAVEGYQPTIDGYNITNTHTPEQTSVSVVKIWDDANNQDGFRPNDVTVILLADGQPVGDPQILSEGNNWSYTFTNLDVYKNGKKIVYTVQEIEVDKYVTEITGDQTTGYTITNVHVPETVEVSGSKTWLDNDNQDGKRPESITINLLKNGEVILSIDVTEEDEWAWSFTDLPKYENGQKITYTITENVVAEYTTTVDGYNVINKHDPEKTSVTVNKAWQDNNDQDGLRSNSVTVVLLANGENTGKTLILTATDNWQGTFTDLDVYANGEVIAYTIQELAINGYTTNISGSHEAGYTITNVHEPETISISGTKNWVDNDDQDGKRPESITIRLFADGEQVDFIEVTEADGWAWSFENLPKYRDHGVEIKYTISEDGVEEYVATVNGFDVTNTHDIEKTSVQVTKSWQDNNDQDGLRAQDITVVLVANGTETEKTLVLNDNNNWTGIFEDLDKYLEGEEIKYTVKEIKIEGYETVISGSAANGYLITNSHTPETIEIKGSKTWKDNDNQDGFRPESITIKLLKNGEVQETITVTEADGWAWSFVGLPKYENHGTEIVYSIVEEGVEDYSTEYDGYNVINSHTPEQTSVTVTKSWQDSDDQDGLRPKSITVVLLADGKDTGLTLDLTEANNWTGSFTELDKYADGKEIVYTVDELTVEGYTTTVSGSQTKGYTITNVHEPATVEVSGHKIWDDNDNQDGKRPESITINLLADGVVKETITVTEADDWSWVFENLPKYRDHGVEIIYSITENGVEEYTTTYSGYNVTNTHAPEKTSVTVTKSWLDADDQDGIRSEFIIVKLLANGTDTGLTVELSEVNKWTGSFTDLDKYENGEVIEYTVEEIVIDGYNTTITGNQNDGYQITNSHTPETIEISGKKIWDDNENQDGFRPESITINLLADGKVIKTITVTEEDGWAWTFTNLDKYRDHGTEIEYSITEEAIDDYSTTYNGFDVTNTHTPEQTSVTVSKSWNDNNDQDGIRANSITVVLLANGQDTGKTVVLNEGNNWTGSFTELDKYENGEVIEYTVAEIAVEGYTTVITGNQTEGYRITNSHTPEVVEVSGEKIWDDNDNQDGFRPESITISLLADGVVKETITVTEADGWAWSFTNLPKYRDHGTLIDYSIIEEAVEDYTTTYNGYDVTNTHAPEKTSVTVTKAWLDENDQDGIRPNDVTVILLANGEETEYTLVLNEGNNWTDSFENLDKYADGQIIVYTVEEKAVDGYTATVTGDQNSGYTITNSHTPETISFYGSKTWDDNDNQDGFRPESITINLLANGQIIDSIEVTEEDNWTWIFENLPKYENHGSLIYYSVSENAVEGYTTIYDGLDIINVHTPEEVSLTVSKAWYDNNDQDGIRPDTITVILLANGIPTGDTLILGLDGQWTDSFVGLPKYEDGMEIAYTIVEVTVEGYETVITGDMTVGYTITNSHTPEITEVAGSKTWDDNNNQDGVRPESITVNLLANGERIETITVTEAENWSWSFTNLPKYANGGVEIVYAVTEDAVEGYSTTYDGYNITNSYTPAEISLTVSKAWADSDNAEGKRPEKITITLYADGVLVDQTLVLTAEDNWSGSFVGLPKYANGVEIVYTIGEVAVEGYNTVIRGGMTDGFVVTNSRTVIPQTGDDRNPMLWALLMISSLAVVAYVELDSRKRRMAK